MLNAKEIQRFGAVRRFLAGRLPLEGLFAKVKKQAIHFHVRTKFFLAPELENSLDLMIPFLLFKFDIIHHRENPHALKPTKKKRTH